MRSLYDRVVAFVARHLGVSADDLKPDTTLFGDLNADSDDGVELLEEFAREFSVDMSGYDPSRYFGTENLPFWLSLWWLIPKFRKGSWEERAGKQPICIADLVRSAELGRWVEPQGAGAAGRHNHPRREAGRSIVN